MSIAYYIKIIPQNFPTLRATVFSSKKSAFLALFHYCAHQNLVFLIIERQQDSF